MKQHFKQKKAQIAVSDMFIAFFIFSILLTALILIWGLLNEQLSIKTYYDNLAFKTFQISNSLVTSPGVTTNDGDKWNPDNVNTIGLANFDRTLSMDKVINFTNLSTQDIKRLFKTGESELSGFDFRITNLQGDQLVRYSDNITKDLYVTARRFVIYNDEKAIMELTFHA